MIFLTKLISVFLRFHPFKNSIRNRFHRTSVLTCAATNAFWMVGILHRVHLHFAGFCTCAAVRTLFLIDPIAKYRNRVKHRIHSAQWTYVFTKRPVNQDRENYRDKQQSIFPGIQDAQRALHRFIHQYQWYAAFQRARRTNQFAEIGRALA